MQWTEEQEAFFKAVSDGNGSITLNAVAGAGKTTTMKRASQLVSGALACAFNVKIKKDLEEGMTAAAVKTLNGLGHGALMKFLNKRQLNLDTKKLGDIVSTVVKEEDLNDDWMDVLSLARAIKVLGVLPERSPGSGISLLPLTDDTWEEVIDFADLDSAPSAILLEMAKEVVRRSIAQSFQGLIDFDDQLYIPVLFGAPFQKYPVIFNDETQDLNKIQHKMLQKSLLAGGRLFAVGDPYQSIYGFRGAMQNSMSVLTQTFQSQELELSYSFRCGTEIIKHAQELVPHIKSPPGKFAGSVHYHEAWTTKLLAPNTAILCRNNGPMLSLAYKLIRSGIGVYVLGRDLGKGLETLIKKLSADDIKSLALKAKAWYDTEMSKARANRNDSKQQRLTDKYECLITVMEDCQSISDVLKKIHLLFSKESGPIMLSTIHKAKGLEFNRVLFLNHDLLYKPWAHPEQERNLDYVARTRAIQELHYVQLENFIPSL